MKRFLLIVIGLVLGLAAGYFVFKVPEVIPKPQTATVTETAPKPVSESKPKIVYKDTTIYRDTGTYKLVLIHDTIPVEIPVDTPSIVADYLLQRDYVFDTTLNEVHAVIKAMVFANKLAVMQYSFENLKHCRSPDWQYKVGITGGINDIAPSIQIEHKKLTYQVSYDLIGTENGIRGGVFYGF